MADMAPEKLKTLVDLSIAGDKRAFSMLYQHWYPSWFRFCVRQLNDRDLASDALQEASLQIAKNIQRLKNHDTFAAWAFTILRRRCIDQLRKTIRYRDQVESLSREWDLPESSDPEDARSIDLDEAIEQLSPSQSNLITLFYTYGLTVQELALVYAVPAGTIKSRLNAIRSRLKAVIQLMQKES